MGCLVTPPSWRAGASAPPGDKGTVRQWTGCTLCLDYRPLPTRCFPVAARGCMGVTWALHQAWELGGGDGCGGQVVEASVWVPAGGGRRAGRGWSGAWRGSGLSFVSCRNPPFHHRHVGVWCLSWLARRARAPGLPGGHWGQPSPHRLRPGPLTGSAVRVQLLPFLFQGGVWVLQSGPEALLMSGAASGGWTWGPLPCVLLPAGLISEQTRSFAHFICSSQEAVGPSCISASRASALGGALRVPACLAPSVCPPVLPTVGAPARPLPLVRSHSHQPPSPGHVPPWPLTTPWWGALSPRCHPTPTWPWEASTC